MKEKLLQAREYLMNLLKMDSRNFQLLLNVILIIVINIAAAVFSVRFDLTSNNTYSLSARSRETVSGLSEKLKIKVFFSGDLPAEHAAVYRYLKDILDEYNFYGNRNFSYEIIDQGSLESQAKDYGIEPVQSREFVNDQVKLRSVYMGVVIQHGDIIEKIDSLTSAVGLEYEITSRIEKMTGKIDRLQKLDKPLQLTLYLDPKVMDLPIEGISKLEEIITKAVVKSNIRNYDRIQFKVIDPSKGDNRDLDAFYGISRLKWKAMKTRSGRMIPAGEGFFGLVLEGNSRFVRIELDVAPTIMGTNVITGLQNLDDTINNGVGILLGSSQKIGYVRGHGIAELNDRKSPEGAGLFAEIMSDMYQLEEVDLKNGIPEDIRVLVINGPTTLFSDAERYRIDQFLMEGKSVLYFVNSFMEVNSGRQGGFMGDQPIVLPVTSGIEEMAEHYGIKIAKSVVLDKNCTKINMGQSLSDYPLIPLIGRKGLNRKNPITGYLNSALFVKTTSVEPVEKLKERGVDAVTLVSTSEYSWLMEGRINFNPFFMSVPEGVQMKSYPVAVLASGKLGSFFKGREIPAEIKSSATKSQLSSMNRLDSTVASGRSELIVVGSSDINSSGFINSARRILSSGNPAGAYSNDILLHSMVDYLAGNRYVPEMKSKCLDFNPLIKTGDNTRFFLKAINMGVIPFMVVLMGLIVWRRRVARKRIIENQFAAGNME